MLEHSLLHPSDSSLSTRRRVIVVGIVVLLLALAAALTSAGLGAGIGGSVGSGGSTGQSQLTSAAADLAGSERASGARRICGTGVLRGPAHPPAGAVRITPGRSLPDAVDNAGPGTTFWISRGIHRFGSGAFDQVRPKDGDVFIGAPGAVIDGQHKNRYAFAGDASNVRISTLRIQNFGRAGGNQDEGVVNHDAGHGWVITGNTIAHNAGAGILVGTNNQITRNCLTRNGQYAFNAFEEEGVSNVSLTGNEISFNNTDNWEKRQPGCGCSGGGKFWNTTNADVVGNYVHDNRGVGVWADTNNTGFLIRGNVFVRNADVALLYEISYNATITRNVFKRNAIVGGRGNPGFPTGAIYLSESGGDTRAGARFAGQLVVSGNKFVDNWGGVTAYENSDRFAGSPNNSSSGTTTTVNPAATEAVCGDKTSIRNPPYIDDCRWKTQNLTVTGNRFIFSPRRVGHGCSAARGCGFSALFANYGTDPSWSPYQGTVVEDHITFDQNNRWSANRYVGPWRFMIHEQGHQVSWRTWRAAPYAQDQGSTLRR